jgi:hypothetical protein
VARLENYSFGHLTVIAKLEQRGVQVECLPTDAAVHRYGELDERRTAAALHLTC